MWVVGYDPADTNDLLAGGLEHWLRRHGSPFHPDSEDFIAAHWIPIPSIPGLKDLATSSDFILIYAPEIPPPNRHRPWSNSDPPPPEIREIMNEIGPENALLSIEFTYHADFGTNVIERFQNLLQPALMGIPSFISMPMSVIQNRGTGRLGNSTQTQVHFEDETREICKQLVETNQPVTYESVSDLLPEEVVLPRDLEGGVQANNDSPAKTTFATWKVPLMCGVIRDTWALAGRIQMPETTVNFPDQWRMSGCQLQDIYDLISESIRIRLEEGRRFLPTDRCIQRVMDENESAIVNLPPPSSGRNQDWDDYCSVVGFPRQSRADMHAPPGNLTGNVEIVQQNHHTLLSPSLTTIRAVSTSEEWQLWVNQASLERACNGNSLVFKPKKLRRLRVRNYNQIDLTLLPEEIESREVIATVHIKDYTASIVSNPIHHPMRERSYQGRTLLMDVINFRENAGDNKFPRAVVPNRRGRRVILAADLPISSEVFEDSLTDATIAEWYRLADIFVLEDGIFLGREWTRNNLVRLA